MKTAGIILLVIAIVLCVFQIIMAVVANYKLDRDIFSYWSLADKSSSIEAKSENIDKFVQALEESKQVGHNALFFFTPDNSWDKNFEALKTLQTRLKEIKTMDVSSFEYQQAIQQITAQEQGEASDMLDVLKGIWYKNNYWYLWNWFSILFSLGYLVLGGIGIALIAVSLND